MYLWPIWWKRSNPWKDNNAYVNWKLVKKYNWIAQLSIAKETIQRKGIDILKTNNSAKIQVNTNKLKSIKINKSEIIYQILIIQPSIIIL